MFSVQFKNTHPQITAMHSELFLAQQNVQKAKLAKCISTALRYTHHWYLLGCDTGLACPSFECVCVCVCMRLCTVTTCGKGWLRLPCQHSEHKGRSKQKEKDTSNPGLVLLTGIIQRNNIMCANNVIIQYLEHNSVNKSFFTAECII